MTERNLSNPAVQFKSVGILVRDSYQPFPLDALRTLFQGVGARLYLLNQEKPAQNLDLVMAMGGDGTVLKALHMHPEAPVLPVNFGTVGFLTAGDRDDLEALVMRLLKGDFFISQRMLLHCEFSGDSTHVINEIVLRSSSHMINVEVFVNGARIRTIRGDGVIVGTPTGSTGYLLSTGAPIVMPDVNCFILDGLNEYNFSSRAIILSPESQIRLRLGSMLPKQRAFLLQDGNQIHELRAGEEILLARSETKARMIFFEPDYFFHNLASRLSWV